MVMTDLDINWNDPRTLGSPGRNKRSNDVLYADLSALAEAVNTVRRGHGLKKIIDSPTIGDTVILDYNATLRDLMFGAAMSARLGTGTVTWKLKHGSDLGALADIGEFVTADNDVGTAIAAATLDALDPWEAGFFLVLEITGTTGVPTQFMVALVVNS